MGDLRKIKLFINKIYLNLLEIIFPRFCVSCKKEGRYICDNCLVFISESGFVCPVCQKSSYFGKTHDSCYRKKELNGLISFWDYDGVVKKAIHLVKYKGYFHILEEIIEHTINSMSDDSLRFSFFIDFIYSKETKITFVPLYKEKEKERGFNQSEVFSNYLVKIFKKERLKLLERNREVESQTNLNKKERFLNVLNSFSFNLNQGEIIPKKILLVDDVWTSGATMKECSKILKKNGVQEVWGLTIAKT